MTLVRSFPPITAPGARVLILGTMPGVASLAAGRYYAHPRNAFWPITSAICRFDPGAPYERRVAALCARGIAVWDVLACCERAGSLDSDIAPASMAANDFAAFFAAHPRVRDVCCNGGTAYRLFTSRVLPELAAVRAPLRVHQLPSTSPAHAGVPFARKLAAWRAALAPLPARASGRISRERRV